MVGFKEKIELSVGVVSDFYFKPKAQEVNYQVQKCIICIEKDVNTLIEPCGHALLCQECLLTHMK
jgi:hypothetical protein